MTWILRSARKDEYLEGTWHKKWLEWRVEWCWIKQEEFPEYCLTAIEKLSRNPHWSDVGPRDEEFSLALSRIEDLRAPGLTLEAVGADFLWRWLAPLQRRSRLAWEYKNASDTMRLRPSLANNLTVLDHDYVIRKIFNKGCTHKLPDMVLSLCNNTARDSILAMMSACNAQGILADWVRPEEAIEDKWYADLAETPEREETGLIHPTKQYDLDLIARRVEAVGGVESS